MSTKNPEKILLGSLSASLDDEELTLSAIQGLIAAEISYRRIQLGLSQKEFAEKMGVTQSLVSRWENGDSNFTMSTLVKIASRLDIEMQSPFVPASAKPCCGTQDNILVFSSAITGSYKSYAGSTSTTYSTESDRELKEM